MKKEVELSSPTDVLKKLKLLLGLKKGYELANLIGVKPNTMSSWKVRDSMPYHRLLAICMEYNIDLNDLFFEHGPKDKAMERYIQVPILYISKYWDYYFNPNFKNTAVLPWVYFPEKIDFDLIIQIATENEKDRKSKLLFTFCKRVEVSELSIGETYVMIVKDRGFLYAKLISIDFILNTLQLDFDSQRIIEVKIKDCLELFLCKGFYIDS